MSLTRGEYASLADSPSESQAILEDKLEDDSIPRPSLTNSRPSWLLICSCFLALVTSLVSIAINLRSHVIPASHKTDYSSLRRPLPYPGLQEYFETNPPPAPLHPLNNRPISVFQIDTSDPTRALREDVRTKATHQGTVTPELDHIVVHLSTSTIIQFRTLDYGMETCILKASPPKSTNASDIRVYPSGQFTVFTLDTTLEIHPTISWGHAAPRKARLASFTFPPKEGGDEEVVITRFRCEAVSFLTLEVGCENKSSKAGERCSADFWQDRSGAKSGIYITQLSSIDAGVAE